MCDNYYHTSGQSLYFFITQLEINFKLLCSKQLIFLKMLVSFKRLHFKITLKQIILIIMKCVYFLLSYKFYYYNTYAYAL